MQTEVKKPRGRPKKISDEVREAVLRDLRNEESLRVVAKRYDVSHSFVAKVSQDNGINNTRRERTKNATRARVADAALSRALLSQRFLEQAHKMLDLMDQKYQVYGFTGLGDFTTNYLERPQAGDMRSFMQAATYASDRHIAIARFDFEADSARSDVDQWLKEKAGAIESSESGERES